MINTTYDKYLAYKDSGVEWLGEIPEGWKALPGLSFICESKEKNTGMKRNTVLSLSYGKIRVKAEKELTGLVPESFETYQFVNKGDIIFRPTDLQNDKVSLRTGISEYEGIITSAYINLRMKSHADNKFYSYLFRAIDNNKVIYGLGSGLRQNISYLDFRRFVFPFPPLAEQTAIANFLDHKTEKIDTAITQKEKMIVLLKERKQIMIQNAVTKGLDPNATMKDSGVEWIGEIPVGWEVVPLKHLYKETYSGGTPSTEHSQYWDGGIKWISSADVKLPFLVNTLRNISELGLNRSSSNIAPKGSVIIVTRSGILQHTLPISILMDDMAINQDIKCFVLRENLITPNYLLCLVSGKNNEILVETRKQGATVESIDMDDFANLKIPLPPFNEQSEIIIFVNEYTVRIDKAIAVQKQQIEKLKEYKAVLIDSAVTGKIKVG